MSNKRMIEYFLLITIISSLWHLSLSTNECNRTITDIEITFLCPLNISDQELRLYDLTSDRLDNITSIIAHGLVATSSGPFTSIPPNICLLRNLQKIDFSSNQITEVDPLGSLINCLSNVITLDLHSNNISQFPSLLINKMPNLKNLYFQNNQLIEVPVNAFIDVSTLEIIDFSYNQLTTFELWTLQVKTSADFSNNQISTITNKYFFNQITNRTIEQSVYLTNNSPTINFTDGVYEMYDQCHEVDEWYIYVDENFENITVPWFTRQLASIDFGTTQINCSCDQLYFLRILVDDPSTYYEPNLPIKTATCLDNSQTMKNTFLLNSSCANPIFDVNSTLDFSQIYPKLCKLTRNEPGNITIAVNISIPSLNVSTYPHYETVFLNPGACFLTFTNQTTMDIQCTNDTSNSLSSFPETFLSNTYLSTITRVIFPSTISSLPSYLCSLPSHQIDLSYEAFTTLSDGTFPCLDSFQTINLSFNQITSVNISNGDFKTLTSLDLSSNYLTSLPYTILHPTPTSLRYLDLRNNSIYYIDLFIYTLKNLTINLDDNPINSTVIINPQNITLNSSNTTSTVNITFPSSIINSTIIIQDTIALTYGLCNNFVALRNILLSFRSTATNVLLSCTCLSFGLRQVYQQNGYNITNDFNCSNATDAKTFYNLNNTTCTNVTNFQSGLCLNQTAQTSMDITTMGSVNNSIELTSTSTILMINSSSALNTPTTDLVLTTTAPPLQSGGGSGDSNANRTGLIVGLVVGIVGFFILVGALVAAILILKAKGTAGKKPVKRTAVIGQGPGDSLSSRVQSRNLRSVKLAPITTPSSPLPKMPVTTVTPTPKSSILSHPNPNLRTSAKGIPVRLDPIRSPSEINPQYPPNSNALNNSLSFRPINNVSPSQVPIHPPKPRSNQMLNTGGDLHY